MLNIELNMMLIVLMEFASLQTFLNFVAHFNEYLAI